MYVGPVTERDEVTLADGEVLGLIDQVKDIITVGEFYDLAAGGQIIFT